MSNYDERFLELCEEDKETLSDLSVKTQAGVVFRVCQERMMEIWNELIVERLRLFCNKIHERLGISLLQDHLQYVCATSQEEEFENYFLTVECVFIHI